MALNASTRAIVMDVYNVQRVSIFVISLHLKRIYRAFKLIDGLFFCQCKYGTKALLHF